MRVAFRTDASIQIGTGHVMRCLTLADELSRRGHKCRFICRAHEGHLGDLIASKGYELSLLANSRLSRCQLPECSDNTHDEWLGVPWQQDAEETLEALSLLRTDWLVVDHYGIDSKWEKRVQNHSKQIMVIDDLVNRSHDCDLLLDQTYQRQADEFAGYVASTCRCLTGTDYALLRPEFAQLHIRRQQKTLPQKLKRVFVFLGGADPENVSLQVLEALTGQYLIARFSIDLVLGAQYRHVDDMLQYAARVSPNIKVHCNVENIAELMAAADVAIGAAGTTSWERCCVGLPTLTYIYADNQKDVARKLERAGAIELWERPEQLIERLSLLNKTPERLAAMRGACLDVCDGRGVARVVEIMESF